MADTKPPKQVIVGPYTHTLVFDQAAIDRLGNSRGEPLWGNFDQAEQRITMASTLPPDMARVTLLHEVLHACTELAGRPCGDDTEDDERVVAVLAPILIDVLRRNPDLCRFLLADADS